MVRCGWFYGEKAVKNLVENYLTHPEVVFIGSRFVLGGGYKGFDKDKKNDVTKIIIDC